MLRYLRFEAGRYGLKVLGQLAAAKNTPQAIKLAREARLAMS